MHTSSLPRFKLLRTSRLSDDSDQSLLIALLRGLAALQVAAAHLRAEVFPSLRAMADPPLWYEGLAFATGFAHQAVVVFFLISGWLVGGSLLDKLGQPGAIRSYAIDRVSRLWTVLIPTFVLMLAAGLLTGVLNTGAVDYASRNAYSLTTFAGNLFGLQTVSVQNFGGNYSLWSLANETWYYVLFPLLLLPLRPGSAAGRVGSAAAMILIGALLPAAITVYFTLWLLGAAFSRVRISCGEGLRAAWLALLAGVSVYYRITGSNDDLVVGSFIQDLVCSLVFLLFLSALPEKAAGPSRLRMPLARMARFFSEFSFTLYVLHVPLIGLLRYGGTRWLGRDKLALNSLSELALYFGMLAAIVGGAYLFYLLFEAHTYRVRRVLKGALRPRVRKPVTAPAVPVEH